MRHCLTLKSRSLEVSACLCNSMYFVHRIVIDLVYSISPLFWVCLSFTKSSVIEPHSTFSFSLLYNVYVYTCCFISNITIVIFPIKIKWKAVFFILFFRGVRVWWGECCFRYPTKLWTYDASFYHNLFNWIRL